MDDMNLFDDFFAALDPSNQLSEEEAKQKEAERQALEELSKNQEDDCDLDDDTDDEELDDSDAKVKKATTGKTKQKKGPSIITLPVKVVSGTWEESVTSIQGKTSVTETELIEYLISIGYNSLRYSNINMTYSPDKGDRVGIAYSQNILANSFISKDDSISIDFTNFETVTVSDGLLNAEYTLHDFPELEKDEVSIADVYEKWILTNPVYKGCQLMYDAAVNICVPLWGTLLKDSDKIDFPVEVYYNGSVTLITEDNVKGKGTYKDLSGKFFSGKVAPDILFQVAKNEDNVLFFTTKFTGTTCLNVSLKGKNAAAKKPEKVNKKHKLPLALWIPYLGLKFTIEKNSFEGREKVTTQDIISALAVKFSFFKDKDREFESYYCSENNQLTIHVVSGKKGAEVELVSSKDFQTAKASDSFYGPISLDGKTVQLFSNEVFSFWATKQAEGSIISFHDIQAELKFPKIPIEILEGIIFYFKQDIFKESIVHIMYNVLSKKYKVCIPNSKSVSSVSIEFSPTYQFMEGDYIVAAIHSHGIYNTVFSKTDDLDECYTGIFGVVGNMDKEIKVRLRMGFEGSFQKLPVDFLFEGGVVYDNH